jgi:hypothetical protein
MSIMLSYCTAIANILQVFTQLRAVCDAGTGSVEAGAARDDLIKRVGSKSALGEYLATLTRRCALLSFGRQMLAEVRSSSASVLPYCYCASACTVAKCSMS